MPLFSNPILILILSQAIFTGTDLLGRYEMKGHLSFADHLLKPWVIFYFLGHGIACLGQLYVFSQFPVGKTMALFGAVSIILSTVLGFFLLQEALSVYTYLGVMIAATAFVILTFAR